MDNHIGQAEVSLIGSGIESMPFRIQMRHEKVVDMLGESVLVGIVDAVDEHDLSWVIIVNHCLQDADHRRESDTTANQNNRPLVLLQNERSTRHANLYKRHKVDAWYIILVIIPLIQNQY